MEEEVELSKLHWQNFLYWFEEKYGELLRLPMISGTDIIERESEKFVAYKNNVPEQYFVVKKYIIGTPWEQYAKETVTTVTE